MTGDEAIRRNVLEDLWWSPRVNATHIGVSVRGGVVELTGHVETFAEKLKAEHTALSVKGVKGVAQEILVRLPTKVRRATLNLLTVRCGSCHETRVCMATPSKLKSNTAGSPSPVRRARRESATPRSPTPRGFPALSA